MPSTVCVLVTDLRREPIPPKGGYARDFLQETQLLYGETVKIIEQKGEWSLVEAECQPKYTSEQGWKGYPGWVKSSHLQQTDLVSNTVIQDFWAPLYEQPAEGSSQIGVLPFGAYCKAVEVEDGWLKMQINGTTGFFRKAAPSSLLEKAQRFIGHPYLWGGCSPYFSSTGLCTTSVDCSALVHLLYRSIGIVLPRDARDQMRCARPSDDLQPGDLVFRANPETPEKIDHVMVYEQGENLIEACLEVGCVRRITFEEKLGLPRVELAKGKQPKDHYVVLGSLILK